jgi:hypothetical protein
LPHTYLGIGIGTRIGRVAAYIFRDRNRNKNR